MTTISATTPLVFLDIDGVLSFNWAENNESGDAPELSDRLMFIGRLDREACTRLQGVCDRMGAAIVVTATARKYVPLDTLEEAFRNHGLTARVVGRTPCLRHHEDHFPEPWSEWDRGLEVQWWLRTYFPSDKAVCNARFVCLDDGRSYGDLRGKLVQTRTHVGLTDLEVPYIEKHLQTSLMESMAAGGNGRVLFKYDALTMTPWWGQQRAPFGPNEVVCDD